MRSALLAFLALAACAPVIVMPLETGVPARPVPPSTIVTITEEDIHALHRETGGVAYTPPFSGGRCRIRMPFRHQVSATDWQYLLAHEMRHCAGQTHTHVLTPSGRNMVIWRDE